MTDYTERHTAAPNNNVTREGHEGTAKAAQP